MLRRLAPMLCGLALLVAFSQAAMAACQPDLAAAEPVRCRFFVQYLPPGANTIDDRIVSRVAPGGSVRSFALLIGIDTYPNFQRPEDRVLAPAKTDLARLVPFLQKQGFDEIIVLQNQDATKENIDYFLDVYLNKQLDIFGPATRVLIAHTGHGGPGSDQTQPGTIILSAADGPRDYENIYPMAGLAPKLKALASRSYHFVALFGSCYSGGIFSSQQPGGSNDWYPKAPGAHAVSSTPHDDLAYGFADQNGSIFFDKLIEGVETGLGDVMYAGWAVGSDGDLHRIGGGIVRLGALMSYVSAKIDGLGINAATKKPFPQVLIGRLSGNDHDGAFFFVGPPKDASVDVAHNGAPTTIQTADTGSALFNNADVKVFSAPDSYAVMGLDVSHYNEAVDWPAVARAGYSFAYMKATESVTLQDGRFPENWAGAATAGLKHGAYHVFDYCEDVDRQFANIARTVPNDPAALPIALDLSWRNGPTNPRQVPCAEIGRTRQRLLALAALLRDHYGKTPVIFANESGLNDLIDTNFQDYPLWLQSYGDRNANPLDNLKLKGAKPWTLWQHTSTGRVPGIIGNVDIDVFFGNRRALDEFVAGRGNVALQASRR